LAIEQRQTRRCRRLQTCVDWGPLDRNALSDGCCCCRDDTAAAPSDEFEDEDVSEEDSEAHGELEVEDDDEEEEEEEGECRAETSWAGCTQGACLSSTALVQQH
jgi:hypothetical protein